MLLLPFFGYDILLLIRDPFLDFRRSKGDAATTLSPSRTKPKTGRATTATAAATTTTASETVRDCELSAR